MKKLLFTLLTVSAALNLSAQITLEKTYNVSTSQTERQLQVINLEISGYKYALRDMPNNQVRLYNLDHSIFKTINVPVPPGYTNWYHGFISERLFNLDPSIEMIVQFSGGGAGLYPKSVVLNEGGSVLLTVDTSDFDLDVPMLFNTGNNSYKLIMQSGNNKFNVYALPGSIPCDKCGNGLGIGKLINTSGTGSLEAPIPNPSNGQVKIGYELPIGVTEGEISIYNTNGQKVKSLKVDGAFSYVTVDNSSLPSGTYYYLLSAEGQRSESRKMVIIP